MKNIIILLMFLTFYIETFPNPTQLLNISYEHSEFLGKTLNNIDDLSLAYSQWQIQEYNKSPNIFIKFSFGNFDSQEEIKENYHMSLAYEQMYSKKFSSFITQNFLLGLSYNIFDFSYNEPVTYNNSQFTGDSIHALELYLSYGLEFALSQNTSINLAFVPQLFLFKDNTERGLDNNIFKNTLATGYNFGLTHKF